MSPFFRLSLCQLLPAAYNDVLNVTMPVAMAVRVSGQGLSALSLNIQFLAGASMWRHLDLPLVFYYQHHYVQWMYLLHRLYRLSFGRIAHVTDSRYTDSLGIAPVV